MFPTESLMCLVTGYTYEAGIACVLYGKQSACKTTKTNKRSYPYITKKGEDRECNPCQYIANIKDKTVTGYKYLDLSDAAGIIASVSGRARGKLRLFTQIDGDCIGEIEIFVQIHGGQRQVFVFLLPSRPCIFVSKAPAN